MPEDTQKFDDPTGGTDQSYAEWQLLKRMEQEIAAKKSAEPDFFDAPTALPLTNKDIIEATTVVQQANPELSEPTTLSIPRKNLSDTEKTVKEGKHPVAPYEDITFLHPRDVIGQDESSENPVSAENLSQIDERAMTELSPADVISEIEKHILEQSTSPLTALDAPFSTDTNELLPEDQYIVHPPAPTTLNATLEDINRAIDTPLEQFLQKDTLEGADAYRLCEMIGNFPDDPDIRAFTKKIAPTHLDYELFWENLERLSPEFVQSVLAVGGYQEVNLDAESGHQKIVVIYTDETLTESGLGHVIKAYIADSDNRKLAPVLIKVPLEKALGFDNEINKAVFEGDVHFSRKFNQIARERSEEPNTKHLLLSHYLGHGFVVMPIVSNPDGKIESLFEMAGNPDKSAQEFAHCLAGGTKGLQVISEQGIIDVDLKMTNIMQGKSGGVLIDWGGFLDKGAYSRGDLVVKTNSFEGNLYPLMKNKLETLKDEEYWEHNNGNIQRTPHFISMHLLAQEISGQMPAGSIHKFSLYRILESYFEIRQKGKPNRLFALLTEVEKINFPLLDLKLADMTSAEQLLYDLYLRLHKAHRHPYRFRDNNPDHGIDPEYISLEEVTVRLEEIAKLKI